MVSWAAAGVPKAVIPSTALYHTRHIEGSPKLVKFYPGDVDPATSNVPTSLDVVTNGVANFQSSFRIQAMDSHGNFRYNSGADLFTVTLTGTEDWAGEGRVDDAWPGGRNTPITIPTVRGLCGCRQRCGAIGRLVGLLGALQGKLCSGTSRTCVHV